MQFYMRRLIEVTKDIDGFKEHWSKCRLDDVSAPMPYIHYIPFVLKCKEIMLELRTNVW